MKIPHVPDEASIEKEIKSALASVVSAYKNLLRACESLSGASGEAQYIIHRMTFPKTATDRTCLKRFDEWGRDLKRFTQIRIYLAQAARNDVLRQIKEAERAFQKKSLLEKLNLTDEQKILLGIETRQDDGDD
jgi:hypothetical protein